MNKILIRTKEKTFYVDLNDVLYCKAAGAYSVIYMVDKEEIVTSINLLKLFERVKGLKSIIRVSQSFLVNMQFVKSIHHSTKEIELHTNNMIPFTITVREIEHALMNNSKDYPNYL